jgi:hypothetical protein
MGSGRWDSTAYASYSTRSLAGKSVTDIYTSRKIQQDLDPSKIVIRESRDSEDNPMSTAIILGLDVTGSMSPVLEEAIKGFDKIMTGLFKDRPVTDPHIMCMGIGDLECDQAPLQLSQFEADIRIVEQLKRIWLEQAGGGNSHESYTLPWYFAANKTSIDCFEKRAIKGIIITVGDENPPPLLDANRIKRIIQGEMSSGKTDPETLLKAVSVNYDVYHIMVAEGNYFRGHEKQVTDNWTDVLGERAIVLDRIKNLPDTIVKIISSRKIETSNIVGMPGILT